MNTLSGYTEIEMGGKTLPFKFGTNCWALFCEMRGIEFHEIASSGVFGSETGAPNIIALRDLFYCAYKAAKRSRGEIPELNVDAFGDLLDESKDAMVKLGDVLQTAKIMGFSISELVEENKKKVKSH